jgi:hypothetical protein
VQQNSKSPVPERSAPNYQPANMDLPDKCQLIDQRIKELKQAEKKAE